MKTLSNRSELIYKVNNRIGKIPIPPLDALICGYEWGSDFIRIIITAIEKEQRFRTIHSNLQDYLLQNER